MSPLRRSSTIDSPFCLRVPHISCTLRSRKVNLNILGYWIPTLPNVNRTWSRSIDCETFEIDHNYSYRKAIPQIKYLHYMVNHFIIADTSRDQYVTHRQPTTEWSIYVWKIEILKSLSDNGIGLFRVHGTQILKMSNFKWISKINMTSKTWTFHFLQWDVVCTPLK